MLKEKIKKRINHIIKKTVPSKIFRIVKGDMLEFASLSYSQEGEDMILARIFGNKNNGFYVDIGAHHPERFSNTKHFYDKGWSGINIDALPGSMGIFNKRRPRDINLEIAISDNEEVLKFYSFNEPALNTFSYDLAVEYSKISPYKIIDEINLNTYSLGTILDKFLPAGQPIDFISIDVEGLDLNVLISNNWERYNSQFVLIEFLDFEIQKFLNSELNSFMKNKNYGFYAKTMNTVFFKFNPECVE